MNVGWVGAKEDSFRYQQAKSLFGDLKEFDSLDKALHSESSLQVLLLSEKEWAQSLETLSYTPEELLFTGFCDGLWRKQGRWYPECSYLSVFQGQLAHLPESLDVFQSVLLVGDYEPSRAALVTLFKSGFRSFLILSLQSNSLLAFMQEAQKRMFGLQYQEIPLDDLANLSGEASVFVHGVSKKEAIFAEKELSYLNFLSRPGFLIDFLVGGFLSEVVQETQDEGLFLTEALEIEKLSLEWWKSKLKA